MVQQVHGHRYGDSWIGDQVELDLVTFHPIPIGKNKPEHLFTNALGGREVVNLTRRYPWIFHNITADETVRFLYKNASCLFIARDGQLYLL